MTPVSIPIWAWIGFNLFVLLMLALDLGVFNRKAHAIGIREALTWSAVWISLSLVFNAGIYYYLGPKLGLAWTTGYLIEKALSVDNVFVFLLIFGYLRVAPENQHKVLFWGVIGALLMRGVCIAAGVSLLQRFGWIIYGFGALLIYSGLKMLFLKDKEIEPDKNPVLRVFRRFMPITDDYVASKFFTHLDGRLWATPLFVALLVIETTDLVFAVDSIPAVLSITKEPFLIYTSNVFAILGLRALFFALAGVMGLFHYLHYGLSCILVFVGGKMLLQNALGHMHVGVSLGIVMGILTVAVIASLLFPPKHSELEAKLEALPR